MVSKEAITRRIEKAEASLNLNTRQWVFEIEMWDIGNVDPMTGKRLRPPGMNSIYWLMEDDGTPKGRLVKELTREEAEAFNKTLKEKAVK